MLRKFEFKKPSKDLTRSYVTFAAPLAIYIFFSNLSLQLDKIVLQVFWDSTEVGIFFMMQKIILVMAVVTSSLGPIFFPSISYYHAKRAMKYVRPLASPVILIMAGNDFVAGVDTLTWLAIYGLLIAINVPHIQVVQGCGRSDLAAKVGLAIAISNIALLIVFVPRSILGYQLMGLGSMGAAMASTTVAGPLTASPPAKTCGITVCRL